MVEGDLKKKINYKTVGVHQQNTKKNFFYFDKMSNKFALTTVCYNSRFTLPLVIDDFLTQTSLPENTSWYVLLQNCSDEFCNKIVDLCKKRVRLVLVRFEDNLGLSKAMSYVIALTKNFEYVLNIEDDWILLHTHVPNKNWLKDCMEFMELNTHVSTLALRAYNTDAEKYQYGWTRTIPYRCHEHKDNFNYQAKMSESKVIEFKEGLTFREIPHFLFTFNPCLVRNADYHKTAYPLPVFALDQKKESHSADWGSCEALTMEKTRHLTTYYLNQGLLGHAEDWFALIR